MTTDTDFAAAWKLAEDIPGWLTRDQARLLWDCVLDGPHGGIVLEIGSHRGRSTVVLGQAMTSGILAKVLLRLRLHRVARLAGHDSPYDPY